MKILLLICSLFPLVLFSQNETGGRYDAINWNGPSLELPQLSIGIKSVIPLTLSVTALILNSDELKIKMQDKILAPFNGYHTTLDDYIQFAPIAELYTFDLLKFKARNSVWTQTKLLFVSEIVTIGIVYALKYSLKIQRPNNGEFTAFPSGHTAQAFVSSQMLFNEFYRTNKFIALSGYIFSSATGALRVINNRHWVPDVLLGSGIAILVTNLVYHFEPLKHWNPWSDKRQACHLHIFPRFTPEYSSLKLTYDF